MYARQQPSCLFQGHEGDRISEADNLHEICSVKTFCSVLQPVTIGRSKSESDHTTVLAPGDSSLDSASQRKYTCILHLLLLYMSEHVPYDNTCCFHLFGRSWQDGANYQGPVIQSIVSSTKP